MRIFILLLGINFVLHFLIFRRHDKSFIEFDKSLSDVQKEILTAGDGSKKMDMMTLSEALNYSLENLNEKNEKLKKEIQKNERLSENIAEFYRQMKTLKEADLIFDFFDYDISSSQFTFISGMISALAGESEATEISAENLFNNFSFNITLIDFIKHVETCLKKDCDMNFNAVSKVKEERFIG